MNVSIKQVKKGDFVKRNESSKRVFTKGAYDRSSKRYALVDTLDISREVFVKSSAIVCVGFTY